VDIKAHCCLLEALGNFFGALRSCFPSAKSFRSCRAASVGSGWLIVLARWPEVGLESVNGDMSDRFRHSNSPKTEVSGPAGDLDRALLVFTVYNLPLPQDTSSRLTRALYMHPI
jgi:hypothetical protein